MKTPLAFAFIFALSTHALALDFGQISSKDLEILSSEKAFNESTERILLAKPFSRAPKGIPSRAGPPECARTAFENAVDKMWKTRAPSDSVQKLFDRCEGLLNRANTPRVIRLLKLLGSHYNIKENRRVREVRLHLPGGIVRRGILALQPTDSPRPLVIAQCGVVCDIYDVIAQAMVMHYFDAGPFHLLVLGSVSTKYYLADNHRFSGPGFDEGLQLFQIADMLQNRHQELSKYISSVHVMGMSLGGQSALYAGLFGSYPNSKNSNTPIKSVTALCPVVNLKPSVENLSGGTSDGKAMGKLAWKVFQPFLTEVNSPLANYDQTQLVEVLENLSVQTYEQASRHHGWLLEPLASSRITSPAQYWELSSFKKFAGQVKVPTLVWAAHDDKVVIAKENTETLRETASNQFGIVMTQDGSHCASSGYYNWDTTTGILKEFIIANSPELLTTKKENHLNLGDFVKTKGLALTPGEKYFSQILDSDKGKDFMTLEFKIWSPQLNIGNTKCGDWDPYVAVEGCFRRVEARIPLTNLGISLDQFPQSNAEADALTRWANSNILVTDSNGVEVRNTTNSPTSIKWISY